MARTKVKDSQIDGLLDEEMYCTKAIVWVSPEFLALFGYNTIHTHTHIYRHIYIYVYVYTYTVYVNVYTYMCIYNVVPSIKYLK